MSRRRNARGAPLIAACLVATCLAIAAPAAPAQQVLPCDFGSGGDYSADYAKVSEIGPYKIGEQKIVELKSKVDGVVIQMGIIRPVVPTGARVPVIVQASPYFHPLQTMDLRACEPFLTENFIPHGYAVAFLPVRGTADAGGCMNLMGPEERADLNQAITWLGRQSWSNGSIGMIGVSYDGATQWEVASFGNRYLKTIVPISGVPDVYEPLFGGGRIDWRGPVILNGIYYLESVGFYAPGRSAQHTVEVTACPEYATGSAASTYSGVNGGLDPFHMQGGYALLSATTENRACPPQTCAYFQTKPFDEEFRVAGLPRVELTVVPRGPGGQLTAYLYAASNSGMERLGWAQVDLRFRDGGVDPKPVTPGQRLKVAFDAQPLDAVVPKGARLYVVVSGGSAWNRLPGIPNYPIELLEGQGHSAISVISPRPPQTSFFKPRGS